MLNISLLVTILSLIAPGYAAPANPTYDDINGSCEDFNDVIKTRGLKDPVGNTHPSTLGWTLCQFKASSNGDKIDVTRSTKDGQPCLSIALGKIDLTADVTVIVARWNSRKEQLTEGCRKELQRIDSEIRSHESHHVDDCKNILNAEKTAWTEHTHVVNICGIKGQSEVTLLAALQTKASDELHSLLSKMNHEMEYRSKETHEKIGYGTSGIHCGECSN